MTVEIGAGDRKGQVVGKIDEGFLERMKRGDIFVLGGKKYQFLFSRGMKAYVRGDVSRNPTIPSWFSEQLPLSFDVALEINRFRRLVKERLGDKKREISIGMACFLKHLVQLRLNFFPDRIAIRLYDHAASHC
jgi:Lhr-like helicase